mmetsp:Transcript_74079/g.176671  ORF Transcript_74079/g.176671 Transcript_74079/m.176671 type:complete len:841 (+) Transcript_74079:80-2602(+)
MVVKVTTVGGGAASGGYTHVSGSGGGGVVAYGGGGSSSGRGSAGGWSLGDYLFGLFYERYQVGTSQNMTYVGYGRGNMEQKMVEVSEGSGSYSVDQHVQYGYRPRVCMMSLCCFLCLGLVFIPFLTICQLRALFTAETCGAGQADMCTSLCFAGALFNEASCCANCPQERMLNVNLACGHTEVKPKVHEIVRHHYGTVYRHVPVNHYVKVQMPQHAPIIHNIKMVVPPTQYECESHAASPNPEWSDKHTKWCCYRHKMFCPVQVVDKNIYHHVTKVQKYRVPVPVPMPLHHPIIHNVVHHYHVPSPPQYMHVHVPGPTVYHHVKVPVDVPYPVPQPPSVITVKKEIPVPVPGHTHYVPVPVPTPPHVVTHYHTVWNTVQDESYDCHSGVDHWHSTWSAQQQSWCCSHYHVGCAVSFDCHSGVDHWHSIWSHTKQSWCCGHYNVGCAGSWVKEVHVIHTTHYNCDAGFSNWYHGWSDAKKGWCCDHENRGCPGSWHGHWHAHAVVHVEHGVHVGHGGYDCAAGVSNWEQGWSAHKKDFCCQHNDHKFCVQYHCHGKDAGDLHTWSKDKSDFCCGHFQLGCPATTLSPLGCEAACTLHGETSTCKKRIEWAQENSFSGKGNACNLAYSQIQVECDVCRACSVQAAGCGVQGPGSEPFDCQAALGNWCRAWSPNKKVWCCNSKKLGCQTMDAPPNCDAGAGMVWKKVFIDGHWTWEASGAGGAVVVSKPYACHEGLPNWNTGWSAPKKSWCCAHENLGCPGFVYHGPGAGGSTHVVVTHHYVAGGGAAGGGAAGGGAAGGGAAGGGSWHSHSGGSWHSGGGGSWHSHSSGGSFHSHSHTHVVH